MNREDADRVIQVAVDSMQRRTDEMLLGQYATTAGTVVPSLTYDRLLETFLSVPKAPPPLRVIEVPLYAVQVQARRHPRKKRRLQKKWLKRYGTRTEFRRHFQPGQMVVDKVRGVAYAHADEIREMQAQMVETPLRDWL